MQNLVKRPITEFCNTAAAWHGGGAVAAAQPCMARGGAAAAAAALRPQRGRGTTVVAAILFVSFLFVYVISTYLVNAELGETADH